MTASIELELRSTNNNSACTALVPASTPVTTKLSEEQSIPGSGESVCQIIDITQTGLNNAAYRIWIVPIRNKRQSVRAEFAYFDRGCVDATDLRLLGTRSPMRRARERIVETLRELPGNRMEQMEL